LRLLGRFNVIRIMLKPVPLLIPPHLVLEARLYAPGRSDLDAVCHVLQDYPRIVGELRQLARATPSEGTELDDLLADLQVIARRILEL